ncbi:unnamed protein product [Sphenostylis stenocarpa]|uniref:Uncharacterized protein n=1 Tax=Sphenostylis stenocarpa TaxID=92480 RepID=A0AA86W5V7_9FABA|nr:unnamed protein product [Sphenostylis stenocarpa]
MAMKKWHILLQSSPGQIMQMTTIAIIVMSWTLYDRAVVEVPPVRMKSTMKLAGLRLDVSASASMSAHSSDASIFFSRLRSVPFSDMFSRAWFTLRSSGEPIGNTCKDIATE